MKGRGILESLENDNSYYAMINSLMLAAQREESKLTPEEKLQREAHRRLREEMKIKHAKILKNICPSCDGKLIRGKKDKKNDYKRVWKCGECERKYWV